jgi:tetratricopeptide (TPR) repeat protein
MKTPLIILIILLFQNLNFSQERGSKILKQDLSSVEGKTYALIIGISKYKNIENLKYADKDAIAFKNYLCNFYSYKIDTNDIKLFVNEDAIKFDIEDEIYQISQKVKSGDRVIFYFAGHGDIEDKNDVENGLLLLHGSPDGNYFAAHHEVISIKSSLDPFKYLPKTKDVDVIYIVDACHSGKLKGGIDGRNHTFGAIKTAVASETAILSCDVDQYSLEGADWGNGRGLFSYYLEEGLYGFANTDSDNEISIAELSDFLTQNVWKYSDKQQRPVILSKNMGKAFVNFNPSILDSIKQKSVINNYSYSYASVKGREKHFIEKFDSVRLNYYNNFKLALANGNIITPVLNNAVQYYKKLNVLNTNNENNEILSLVRRQLISSLLSPCDSIIENINKGAGIKTNINQLKNAKNYIDSSLHLINRDHYFYKNLLSRKLLLDALILKGNTTIKNYTISDANRIKQCIDSLKYAKSLVKNVAYLDYTIGLTYLDMFEFDSSSVYLSKYLSLIPNSYVARNDLGFALYERGYQDLAIKSIEESLKINPNFENALTNLAYIYLRLRNYDVAINYCEKALKVNAKNLNALSNLAGIYDKNDDNENALYYYKLILENSKNKSADHNGLAKFYLKIKDYENAENHALLSISIKANSNSYFILGSIEHCRNNLTKAQHYLNQGLLDSKNSYNLNLEIAWLYKSKNNTDSSNYHFNKTLEISSTFKEKATLPGLLMASGDICRIGLNNLSEANKYYENALRLDSLSEQICSKYILNLIAFDSIEVAITEIKNKNAILLNSPWYNYIKAILHDLNNEDSNAQEELSLALSNGRIPPVFVKFDTLLTGLKSKHPKIFKDYFIQEKCFCD